MLSRNDVRIILMAQLLRQVSHSPSLKAALLLLDNANRATEQLIERIHYHLRRI